MSLSLLKPSLLLNPCEVKGVRAFCHGVDKPLSVLGCCFCIFWVLESNTFVFGRHDVLIGTSQTKLKAIFLKKHIYFLYAYYVFLICAIHETYICQKQQFDQPPRTLIFFYGQLFEGKTLIRTLPVVRGVMGPPFFTSATGCNETWVISPHL